MKKYMALAAAAAGLLMLTGCGRRSMNDIIENEPSLTGIVEEVGDEAILLSIRTQGYPYGATCQVSLDVENGDSTTDLSVGDEVVVYYNGEIAESDPLQIRTVYAITLKTPGGEDPEWDRIPMVMAGGRLYYDTGRESEAEGRCGVMDGTITSSVDSWDIPSQENQSNFGTGYGYQFGPDDTLEVLIQGKWMVFEAREGDGSQVRFGDRWIDASALSRETMEWLRWYHSLTEEEQLAISAVPGDLLEASGIAGGGDTQAAAD